MANDTIPVLIGEGELLLAEHLGVSLDDLKRAKIEREEAAALEKQRAKIEREAEEDARKRDIRRNLFAEYIHLTLVRAWCTNAAGVLTQVSEADQIRCPKCGAVPPKLDAIVVAFGDILNRQERPRPWDEEWHGVFRNTAIRRVPVFRNEFTCACGHRFVASAIYHPESQI